MLSESRVEIGSSLLHKQRSLGVFQTQCRPLQPLQWALEHREVLGPQPGPKPPSSSRRSSNRSTSRRSICSSRLPQLLPGRINGTWRSRYVSLAGDCTDVCGFVL